MSKLTAEECIEIVVGDGIDLTGKPHDFTTPGGTGYTTLQFVDKGVSNIILCDGPERLRLQKISAIMKKGKIKPIEVQNEF